VQVLRPIVPGEELVWDYRETYSWARGQRKSTNNEFVRQQQRNRELAEKAQADSRPTVVLRADDPVRTAERLETVQGSSPSAPVPTRPMTRARRAETETDTKTDRTDRKFRKSSAGEGRGPERKARRHPVDTPSKLTDTSTLTSSSTRFPSTRAPRQEFLILKNHEAQEGEEDWWVGRIEAAEADGWGNLRVWVYGTYDENRECGKRKYLPAWIDTRKNKTTYRSKQAARSWYEPWTERVPASDVLSHSFLLCHRNQTSSPSGLYLPTEIAQLVSARQ
jgi:hypothetical protein